MPATFTGQLATLMELLSDGDKQIVTHLSKKPIPRTQSTIAPADLEEADFPGYAPQRVVAPVPEDLGVEDYAEAVSEVHEFRAGAIVTPQTIYAVYLMIAQDGGAPGLLWALPLPRPITFRSEGDLFEWSWRFSLADLSSTPPLLSPI